MVIFVRDGKCIIAGRWDFVGTNPCFHRQDELIMARWGRFSFRNSMMLLGPKYKGCCQWRRQWSVGSGGRCWWRAARRHWVVVVVGVHAGTRVILLSPIKSRKIERVADGSDKGNCQKLFGEHFLVCFLFFINFSRKLFLIKPWELTVLIRNNQIRSIIQFICQIWLFFYSKINRIN